MNVTVLKRTEFTQERFVVEGAPRTFGIRPRFVVVRWNFENGTYVISYVRIASRFGYYVTLRNNISERLPDWVNEIIHA